MIYIQGHYEFSDNPERILKLYGDKDLKIIYTTDWKIRRNAQIMDDATYRCKSLSKNAFFIAIFPDGGTRRIYLKDLLEYHTNYHATTEFSSQLGTIFAQ